MRSIVVTGVSTGIGQATATLLAERGFHVYGSVRKAADGVRLTETLGNAFTPLVFDVCDEAAVGQAAQQVRAALGGTTLAGLVNNAGIAVAGPLSHVPLADYRRQLEVNLVGPLIVTQAFLPLLGTDAGLQGDRGRIVNISSVGGKIGVPFLGPYIASKFGVEGLSESLRRELLFYGIKVVIVAPGSVVTPIWDKAEQMDIRPYEALPILPSLQKFQAMFIEDGRKGYPPEVVAGVIHEALTAASPKPRYAVVRGRIPNWTLPMALPSAVLDRIFAGRLGLKPKT
jgi:NAD(P)-dependent dehydrogenase (short-subunit alcohol dehydrogenase family)